MDRYTADRVEEQRRLAKDSGLINIRSLLKSNQLPLVGSELMERARNRSKALKWLYLTVEMGWRFLINSKANSSCLMGNDSSIKFDPAENIPLEGDGLAKVLKKVEEELAPELVKTQSPDFMGHMTSDIPFPVHIADILASFFNQNLVKSETSGAASQVEKQTLSWFHRLTFGMSDSFYQRVSSDSDKCLGVVSSGGTLGNITALTVARNLRLPECKSLGVYETMKLHGWNRVAILCSKRAHYSIRKSSSIIGFGEKSIVEIPVEISTNKIDLQSLEGKINSLKQNKTLIIAMVGVAGSTETGSIDDLLQMSKISRRHNIWFHVDAAWGGGYLMSPELRKKLSGIENADSVVIDGHKMVGLTMGHGMTLFRDEYSIQALKESADYVIRPNSKDLGKYSIEGSKPFSSLKLWFLIRSVGLQRIAMRVNQMHYAAQRFEAIISEFLSLELTSEVQTNIVTYRFAPSCVREFIVENKNLNEAIWLENLLNDINITLHEEGLKKAPGFVSRTRLESCDGSDINQIVLRAIPINRNTKPENIRRLLSWQINRGRELFHQHIEQGPYESLYNLKLNT